MASDIGICNLALSYIGQGFIASFDDGTKSSDTCKELYADARDAALAEHPWNFATTRGPIAALATAPSFEYGYALQLPSLCLRLLNLEDDDVEYRLEGRTILSNSKTLNIRYIYQNVDPNSWTPKFREFAASKLAERLCMPLTRDKDLLSVVEKRSLKYLAEARSVDSQEDGNPDKPPTSWVMSRL